MSIFSKIEKTKIKSNTFDLTHDKKLSCDMGELVPTMIMDVVPGDKVSIKTSQMIRFAPLIAPVMHQVSVYQHYFFVPNRILWDNWEDFITGGEDGLQQPVWPHFNLDWSIPWGDSNISSLCDYMGLPAKMSSYTQATMRKFSALPFAAYQKIYNDYYRDQNLIDPVIDTLQDGEQNNFPIDYGLLEMRRRAWQHDYFTSALPFTQRGPETLIPLGQTAPVVANIQAIEQDSDIGIQTLRHTSSPLGNAGAGILETNGNGELRSNNGGIQSFLDLGTSHIADLSNATAASIMDLRRAFKLQEYLERNARGGSRYIEVIAAQFGVQSSDKRLQRPEFLGGFRTPVKISEVLQTSDSGGVSPQGNMAGHGIAVGGNKSISMYAEEHGYIIGIMSIMPRSTYQQGFPKHLLREDKLDYYWESFAHIGEQPVENRELFQEEGNDGTDTWGYLPRYSEYKFIPSTVHGTFRGGLDTWHLGRKFTNMPQLNKDFIEMDKDEVSRIFAYQDPDQDDMWCHILNEVKATRKMPYFGSPKF